MRITARGWRRDAGPTLIVDHDVSDARPDNVTSYSQNVLYLERKPKGVVLRIGPAALTLGGRYQVNVALTNDDIVRLFLEIHPELRASLEAVYGTPKPNAAAAE